MANFALLSNGKVVHHHVAASIAELGNDALIYDVVDVTTVYPQPSVNWTLEDGVWFPPRTINKEDLVVASDVFADPAALVAAVAAALEAPASESNSSEEKKTK